MSAGTGPRFEVRVVDQVLAEDLVRCTGAARAAIEPVVAEIRRDGVSSEWLRRCEEEDNTQTKASGSFDILLEGSAATGRAAVGELNLAAMPTA